MASNEAEFSVKVCVDNNTSDYEVKVKVEGELEALVTAITAACAQRPVLIPFLKAAVYMVENHKEEIKSELFELNKEENE